MYSKNNPWVLVRKFKNLVFKKGMLAPGYIDVLLFTLSSSKYFHEVLDNQSDFIMANKNPIGQNIFFSRIEPKGVLYVRQKQWAVTFPGDRLDNGQMVGLNRR